MGTKKDKKKRMKIRALKKQIEEDVSSGRRWALNKIDDTELLREIGYEIIEEFPWLAGYAFVKSNDLEGLLKLAEHKAGDARDAVMRSSSADKGMKKALADYLVERWPYGALEIYTEIKDKNGIEKAKQRYIEEKPESAFSTFVKDKDYYGRKFKDLDTAGKILENLIVDDEEVQYLLGDDGLYSQEETQIKQCEDYMFRIKTFLPVVKGYYNVESGYPDTNLKRLLRFYSKKIDEIKEEHNLLTCKQCTKAYNKSDIGPERTVEWEAVWYDHCGPILGSEDWVETAEYECPKCRRTMYSIKTLAKNKGKRKKKGE